MCRASDHASISATGLRPAVALTPRFRKLDIESLINSESSYGPGQGSSFGTMTTASTRGRTTTCSAAALDPLAESLEAKLSFEDIPTGGIIALPRHNRRCNVSEELIYENDLDSFSFDSPVKPTMLTSYLEARASKSLHIDCTPYDFGSEAYQTPGYKQEVFTLTSPPPPPCHHMQTISPHFEYPENLYIPPMPRAA